MSDTFEIVPGLGVLPIRFGMTGDDVQEYLGRPDDRHRSNELWQYHGGLLGIVFDLRGLVYKVQLSWVPGGFRVMYQGCSVFDVVADDVVTTIGEACEPSFEDYGHSLVFYDLGISLWRPVLPTNYDPSDPEDEYRKGQYWEAVTVEQVT